MMRMLAFLLFACATMFAQPRPHAHNDYLHPRPLEDALSHGFGSVEADVFLVGTELLVAHTKEEIQAGRTLEKLYLAPLKERFDKNNGHPSVILLVDFKSEAVATWRALEPLLKKFEPMLTSYSGTNVRAGAVTVIISGNRPLYELAVQKERLAAIDGRLSDLTTDLPASLVPLVSDNWEKNFAWRSGAISEAERKRLVATVRQAHQQGRLIRFWAIPDNAEAWELMVASGVDLVNTDKLRDLAEFMKARPRR